MDQKDESTQPPEGPPETGAGGSAFTRELLESLAALNNGNFGVRPRGEYGGIEGEIAHTLSAHMNQMSLVTAAVRHVAHQVGPEGNPGIQAEVAGLFGEWRAMVSEVNGMAAILTGQLADVKRVIGALAAGDLSQKTAVQANGELGTITGSLDDLVDRLVELKNAVERLVASQRAAGGQGEAVGG
ncbi:MAG: hypothetical protein AVDCRST_MAG77-1077 [uncultured Chloroflexi bacterium]|uniref:HAMP domain-containing protein n=1 Tax=uncultured Chloroflexota bacterium TaxID=166587 RepID=A0A6J4HVM7_9CHLR|nr:MAG: hypothetical protein AVDCRST_MAG77-1077 [uncultured Chloroflexota bacterium]